uniref:Ig-like domain-containing protein n=1 Tax=Mastacembelus armatus TaxID=205130 RepID=A0A3Q3RGN0_9TELE
MRRTVVETFIKCLEGSFCMSCLNVVSPEAARIICPNEPIEAEIGEDVRLPCLLDPGLDLSDLTVDWTRVNDSKVVFSYRSRMINDIDQLEQYRNRTRLSREDLSVGNMELQMFSAQLSDSGRYRKWTDQSQHPVICVTLRGQRSLFTLPLYVPVFKHHLPIQGLQMVGLFVCLWTCPPAAANMKHTVLTAECNVSVLVFYITYIYLSLLKFHSSFCGRHNNPNTTLQVWN